MADCIKCGHPLAFHVKGVGGLRCLVIKNKHSFYNNRCDCVLKNLKDGVGKDVKNR